MLSYLLFGVALAFEVSPFMSWLSFAMLYVSTLVLVDSVKRLRWTLLFAIGSVAYGSLHAIREWQKYGGMSLGYRPGYVTGDPNYFTLSALLCLPIALYLLDNPRQPRWERRFCIASIVVTMIAVTLAASRGGFLGLTASALFLVWRSKQRRRNFVLVVAVILPLMVLTPSSPLQRLLSPNYHDEYAANERLLLAEAGLNMVKHHPWTGVGAGNFKMFVRQFGDVNEDHIAHNTYISLLAELGIPGFMAYMAVLVATFWSLERVRRRSMTEGPLLVHQIAMGMQAGLVAYLVAVYFVSAEAHKLYWLFVFLSIVLGDLQRRHGRRDTPVDAVRASIPPATASSGRGWVAS
jgi:O-antigen ligase